jgi:DNA mismatch repair protein MutL
MADIISLLPESLSNQIAAGEVVQRPASVVKELLENAIDAGAKSVRLIIKDGGKSLVQVIDNGRGMSETDARMCFERHATSKLKTTDDLFRIRTKGFRGEALAAIAAVAQVELKTKMESETLGTKINIEGGKVEGQEPCQATTGSSFSVKNLFFNVPARRNFLKDDAVELRHIIEEFERVSLAHPEVSFYLNSNKNDIFSLPAGTLKQRICNLFGNHLAEKLIAIEESTPYLKVRGFIGRPDAAVKRKGVQFFFVNNRFIRSPYMHYAILNSYVDLIAPDANPYYYVFLDLPPESIDINIHPTKTEIKFEDEKTVFMLLQSAAQRALGKANVAPSIEFNNEHTFDIDYSKKPGEIKQPGITVNPNYNPFHKPNNFTVSGNGLSFHKTENWNSEFENYKNAEAETEFGTATEESVSEAGLFEKEEQKLDPESIKVFQVQNKYLVSESAAGVIMIDQHRAHERVLFEHYYKALNTQPVPCQQELFPVSSEFSLADYALLMELKEDLKKLGFDIEAFGKNTIVIHGTPADLNGQNGKEVLDGVLENFKLNNLEVKTEKHENLCRSMASSTCIRYGKTLTDKEAKELIANLFACDNYIYSPAGKNIIIEFTSDEIERQFRKR